MILKLDGKSQTLVQVTSQNNGDVLGLYLVPEGISIEEFENAFELANDQDDFEDSNTLGVERIYAHNSILDVE